MSCRGTNNVIEKVDVSIDNNYEPFQEFLENKKDQANLDYMVTTWSSPVTKDELKQVRSILDFWSDEDKENYIHDNFSEIWVANLKDYPDWTLDINEIDEHRKASSETEVFNQEQLELIANAEFSDHLRFSARFNSTRIKTQVKEEYVLVSQSISLVPDLQAEYQGGMSSLEEYLKHASSDFVKNVTRNEVGRCRIFFTVSKTGEISKVKLIETSNYPKIDKNMVKIVQEMPRKWTSAQTKTGEKVDQEFVFTFGVAGC